VQPVDQDVLLVVAEERTVVAGLDDAARWV